MNKRNIIILIIILIIAIIAAIYLINHSSTTEKKNTTEIIESKSDFVKQGSLSFIRFADNQTIKTIAIEIAKDEYSREKGLMYRRSMDESQGMLFVFEDASPRYFWMKNTYISLDIIYVGADKHIVSIQKSAIPLSEESLPSNKDAMYVVEVNAGFVDKYGIKEGDGISF